RGRRGKAGLRPARDKMQRWVRAAFSKLEPARLAQDHWPARRRDRRLLLLRIGEPVEPHQRQGTAALARGYGAKLATPAFERRAGRHIPGDLRRQEAFARAGPMFHAGGHFLPDIAAFPKTDAFKFFK